MFVPTLYHNTHLLTWIGIVAAAIIQLNHSIQIIHSFIHFNPTQARHVHGTDAVVRDTASFVVLLDSLARRHGCRVRVQFFAEAEYIIVGGDSVRACF